MVDLKRQELLVLIKRIANPDASWSYERLAKSLSMSSGEVHKSVRRAIACGLAVSNEAGGWEPVRPAMLEFCIHGMRYSFPAEFGAPARGIPTSVGTMPLSEAVSAAESEIPVWPHPQGTKRGSSLTPLYKTAPDAALVDPTLHEYLALLDALRIGRARERKLAESILRERLS